MTLTASEVRVLGALIEKQITTPEYYPLSLNAVLTACNQKSNREPVVSYDEQVAERALEGLRAKNLARIIYDGNGRVPKHAHIVMQALKLSRPEVSLLCVLMLRGPQTPGELRSRSARMHEFKDLNEVEETLKELMEREGGALAVCLPRQAGFKEVRYAHLLCGEPVIPASLTQVPDSSAPAAPTPAESELVHMLEAEIGSLRQELGELRQQFLDFRKQFE